MAELSSHVRTDFKAVDKREPLSAVMGWLTGDSGKRPVVVDDDRPFGIVNERALMGRSLDSNARVHQFTLSTRPLPEMATAAEARARMAEHRASYLPIEDERHRAAGYVRAIDLARASLNGEARDPGGSARPERSVFSAATAADLAVPVTKLKESQTLGEALNVFHKEYVDYLPVLRADGRVTGVLPRASLLRMAFNAGDKGRKDAGGEKFTLLHDPISGFMDDTPRVIAPTAGPTAVLDTLDEAGYALVGSLERSQGIVTPETLFARG